MKKKLLKIYYKFLDLKDIVTIQYNKNITSKINSPIVRDTDETLNKIINGKVSISRYGDGELSLMNGQSLIFQPYSEKLANRLKDIIISNNKNHVVCIPDVFSETDIYTKKARDYWNKYLNLNLHKIYKIIDMNKEYYDTQVTRLYIDIENKEKVLNRFEYIKELWKGRDVIIVEGEKSRLGIGNDLFNNSKSIERIICPSKDAFSKYTEILEEVKKQDKSKLILIALGPTATVLAYDLHLEGYQAIDIGHIDIEYEWFLQGAKEKCPVQNKYIGEIDGGSYVQTINDSTYDSQIILNLV